MASFQKSHRKDSEVGRTVLTVDTTVVVVAATDDALEVAARHSTDRSPPATVYTI